MRKYQQRQILDIITSLHIIHTKIQLKLEMKEDSIVLNLLRECQKSAIQIGDFVDKMGGPGTKATIFFNEYCEAAYEISQEIKIGISPETLYDVLENRLNLAEAEIKNGIKIEWEVVFFPYKACMWDSLESVYFAAAEDPECRAYVVPIPYFDKNADGTFGKLHYEGNEYPSDIPVTCWEKYDIEERRPDVVFVHNPYDNCNRVTSVHPAFYCRELRKHTDMLVYIPYFILTEKSPPDLEWRHCVEDFCLLPGTIYANKVILQSDHIRQIYIDICKREYENLGILSSQRELENRFCALGSPKFDKLNILQNKKDDILKKQFSTASGIGGNTKKIILYNTGVAAFLKYRDKMLDKIEATFRIVKERKDEVLLLWRPHPLYRSTIQAEAPELLQRYNEIVEKFRCEDYGIYDDTADMYQAIALSDAYYGDGSSLVPIYLRTGKPVMIQSVYG